MYDSTSRNLQLTTQSITFTPVNSIDPSNTTATAMLRLALDNDDVAERNGTIKVTLKNELPADVNYQVHAVNNNATLSVTDDDIPALNETPVFTITADPSVTEAANATADFVISTEVSPNQKFQMWYNLVATGDFISASDQGTGKSANLDFSEGATEVTLSFDIINDTNTENDGTITVTLIPDSTRYTVAASPNDSARIKVFDDETTTPIVSIVEDNGSISEDSTATSMTFKLTATGYTTDGIREIVAELSDSDGDFVHDGIEYVALTYMVNFTDPDDDDIYTGDLIVQNYLKKDSDPEPDANIHLTLQYDNDSSYRFGANEVGVIRVRDDDTVRTVSMVADNGSYREGSGTGASFGLILTGVNSDTTLEIATITDDDGGDYLVSFAKNSRRTAYVNFTDPDGDGIYTGNTQVMLALDDDNVAEADADIKMTLVLNGSLYQLGTTTVGRIRMLDDDSTTPVVSVVADNGEITENSTGNFIFRFTATGLFRSKTLSLRVSIADDGGEFISTAFEGAFNFN